MPRLKTSNSDKIHPYLQGLYIRGYDNNMEVFEYYVAMVCNTQDPEEYLDDDWLYPCDEESGCVWCNPDQHKGGIGAQLYDRDVIEERLDEAEEDNFSPDYTDLKELQEMEIRKNGKFVDSDTYDRLFNIMAHQIVEFRQTSPKSLLEQSIKAVKKFDIKVKEEEVPRSLQKKMVVGLYTPGDEPPDMISERGKELFENLGKVYLDIFKDPDLVFLRAAAAELTAFGEMFDNLYGEID